MATCSPLPRLERVVVTNGNDIAMEETLEEALAVVLGQAEASAPVIDPGAVASPTVPPTPAPGQTPVPTSSPGPTTALPDDVQELVNEANDAFVRAQERLQEGDFAGYGEEIERLEEILQLLAELTDLGG